MFADRFIFGFKMYIRSQGVVVLPHIYFLHHNHISFYETYSILHNMQIVYLLKTKICKEVVFNIFGIFPFCFNRLGTDCIGVLVVTFHIFSRNAYHIGVVVNIECRWYRCFASHLSKITIIEKYCIDISCITTM